MFSDSCGDFVVSVGGEEEGLGDFAEDELLDLLQSVSVERRDALRQLVQLGDDLKIDERHC